MSAVKILQKASSISPTSLINSTLLQTVLGRASSCALVQAIIHTPYSTVNPHQPGSFEDVIIGLDKRRVDDVIRSVNAITSILDHMKGTQERQRKIFLEQADKLIPSSRSSPLMTILFEEELLQQSQMTKHLNNIKENLFDAERRVTTQ